MCVAPCLACLYAPDLASSLTNDVALHPPDIVEGKVNKGIYLREEKGVTLLYYGRHRTSCLSNPAQCGPEGEWPVREVRFLVRWRRPLWPVAGVTVVFSLGTRV